MRSVGWPSVHGGTYNTEETCTISSLQLEILIKLETKQLIFTKSKESDCECAKYTLYD